jgi:hypothetical protein
VPSYADLVLGYFRERHGPRGRGWAPRSGWSRRTRGCRSRRHRPVAFARDDVVFRAFDDSSLIAPIILCHRKGDRSPSLEAMKRLIREFDAWVESEQAAAPEDRSATLRTSDRASVCRDFLNHQAIPPDWKIGLAERSSTHGRPLLSNQDWQNFTKCRSGFFGSISLSPSQVRHSRSR